MGEDMENNYYTSKKAELLADFDGFKPIIKELITDRYNEDMAITVIEEVRDKYEKLIDEIPYIGGDQNPLTFNLIDSTQNLAIYKVLKNHGLPLNDIGELIYDSSVEFYKNYSDSIPPITSPKYISYMKFAAINSQKREYPEDWVYEFVESKGENYDFGLDFIECAICKLYKKHAAEEIMPYICAMDIIISDNGHLGLHRRETLADGHKKCDFRYKTDRKTDIKSIYP
ncbi:MAG: L-2-amino-thiazoline-4-carboxylic acid hydrolase [Methanobacteriaceae archaeon]|nr:L-2-amino-thiazoline-4-carboxylic acid hydrolase [Methanobacteriaceae archaeon]